TFPCVFERVGLSHVTRSGPHRRRDVRPGGFRSRWPLELNTCDFLNHLGRSLLSQRKVVGSQSSLDGEISSQCALEFAKLGTRKMNDVVPHPGLVVVGGRHHAFATSNLKICVQR